MPAGRYLFIPFLRTKSKKRQTKNRSSEKSHKKKTDRTNIIAKLRLRAIKKLGLEWAVNGLGKPVRKKSHPKNRKNSINQSEIAACEQKTTSEKPNFCSNIVFSLYFKIRAKKFTPQNHSLFRSISCFGVTKITTPIWLQKSWKCVNRS